MSGFDEEELERYRRHIVLREVGGPGQAKLKQASVLVIGAGGLGSPLLLYLAAAGVGRIGVVDDDVVDLSNLQRQVLHETSRIGQPKTDSARQALTALNPHVRIEGHKTRITAKNALEMIAQYDIVADGCDNFATRYLVSDACYFARKPLVSAAVGQFTGQLSLFKPYLKDDTGTPLPGYRDLLPSPPPPEAAPSCAEAGIIGALPGVMGSLQAMEVIKEILGLGTSLAGWLLLHDALETEFMKIKLAWRPDNPLTGTAPTITDLSIHEKTGPAACAG